MVEIIAGALVAAGLVGAAYLLSRGRTGGGGGNGTSAADVELADQRAQAREAAIDRRAAELEKRATELEQRESRAAARARRDERGCERTRRARSSGRQG